MRILETLFVVSLIVLFKESGGNALNSRECYNLQLKGVNYRGRVSKTVTGRSCQYWTSQSPHEHSRTASNYPNAGLERNYCRNPDNERAPWCYTTDPQKRWEYCAIPLCPESGRVYNKELPGCYSKADKGAGYRGYVAETAQGLACQRWNSQYPHEHTRTPQKHPTSGLINNYCRNPDHSDRPWCYTTDPAARWQYCNIPVCPECYDPMDLGQSYRGSVTATISGLNCQRWNSQTPHEHTRTPQNYPSSGLESNYCRNPDREPAPWCYTVQENSRWEYCPVQSCPVDCYNDFDSGGSYRGFQSRTESGKKCQEWSSQAPHEHTRTSGNYPNSGLTSNYCRNPDGEERPWCYTTDSATRWEYCAISKCTKCYNTQLKGSDYRGRVSKTVTGRTCQYWTSQSPHKHSVTTSNYPDSGLEGNYCRNPDNEDAPWCYTTDPQKRWEYCAIPPCPGSGRVYNKELTGCYSKADSGAGYRGLVAETENGLPCQRWSSQFPHEHTRTPQKHPASGLINNYCRNPDHSDRPWCYTTDPDTRWQYCNVSVCAECYNPMDLGQSYRGSVTATVSGLNCQRWNSQIPHEHNRTPQNYPSSGLARNYCRNPDREAAPWCYTVEENSRWEYCPVQACPVDCYNAFDSGATYRGSKSRTESGKKCQEWSSQAPHEHTRTTANYPNSGLTSNYCRNPDGEQRPWCYTTDSETRWEYCAISKCTSVGYNEIPDVEQPPPPPTTSAPEIKECYYRSNNGAGYRGIVAETISGSSCQNWNSQYPHEHTRTPGNYPSTGLVSNYCRNPDGEKAPWCYTVDSNKRWEYCPVVICSECYNGADRGASYRGTLTYTISGLRCQRWDQQHPHGHTRTPGNYANSGLTSNYCRNPDGESRPWCYTVDSNRRWQYCPIAAC